jgi:hypothetical protein
MSSVRFYAQVLSLDICIGVVGSGAFVKTFLYSAMKPVWWFLLPASVWVIYTADHLMDARKIGEKAVNVRHKFHFDHFTFLAILAVVIALACAILALYYLPEIVFAGGFMMGSLALLHILLAYWGKIRFGKEISVAVIYSCGVWFAPFLNRGVAVEPLHVAAFAIFLLAALLNLFMNSVIEFSVDRMENQVFGMQISTRKTIQSAVISLSALLAVSVAVFCGYALASGVSIRIIACYGYLFCLCAVPGIILYYAKYFAKNQRYRLPAELIFAAGTLLLLLPA